MSEKINLQDLTALLAEKASITKKDAEQFLRDCFEVMNEALINDKLLKIKDLGTFKLLLTSDRESVDVVSGERVLIPAHYKATFSPDKSLAETVNEPFALFEAVELSEDITVDPEDLEDSENSENQENESKEEPVEEELEASIEEVLPAPGEPQTGMEIELPEEKMVIPAWAIGAIAVIVLAIACFFIFMNPWGRKASDKPQQTVVQTTMLPPVDTDSVLLSGDSAGYENSSKAEVEPEQTEIPENKIVRIRSGDRLARIAEKEYGNKAFWIYIYEENKNSIKNPDILPLGLELVIPPAQKYGIDKNDSASVREAKERAMQIIN
jgi:nucleoid DNA-binding protein/nucleoid-associated protein YgaU